MNRTITARLAVLAAASIVLAGCAGLGATPPPLDTVTLSALAPSVTETGRAKVQVLVAEPKALKILDSQSIVVSTSPTALEYLGGTQWADRLPALVQAKLTESLQNAGIAGGVGLPGQGLAIDYQIITEIREFQISVAGGDEARVSMFIKLLNDRNGEVVASRLFSANASASAGRYPEALDRAFSAVLADIADWMQARL
ncbi:MAG: ABC-type transport auxiliary lipoprotein family protein [Rhizobiaceae bacterium]|jgi:cholesterol transport system auxiliary component|nr:ABC-type transport auxiliary lipoprotein family protein [Rhizobiaceae bacterium]